MTEKIRWGILSTGHISGRFAEALRKLPDAELRAVASRSADTAQKFAAEHGVLKAYGSYSAMAEDPEVDVIYIGTPHSHHLENSVMCMIFQKPPESVFGFGHIGEIGSDEQGAALLKYDKGEIADLSFALRTNAVNDAYVFGTEGYIKIDEIFAVPTKATLIINDKAPEVIEEPVLVGGLVHEAEEVMRCMRKGLKESPFMPLEESLQIMRIMDQIRAPWDLTYPNDTNN